MKNIIFVILLLCFTVNSYSQKITFSQYKFAYFAYLVSDEYVYSDSLTMIVDKDNFLIQTKEWKIICKRKGFSYNFKHLYEGTFNGEYCEVISKNTLDDYCQGNAPDGEYIDDKYIIRVYIYKSDGRKKLFLFTPIKN